MSKEMADVVGMDPEGFTSGLKDDFRGRIVNAEYTAWDYGGERFDEEGKPIVVLAASLEMEILDDEGTPTGEDNYTQFWSAGDIGSFVPSEDGSTPAGTGPDPRDEDEEAKFQVGTGGQYALRVGRRSAFSRSSNWAKAITAIVECGDASGHFDRSQHMTPSLSCLVGLDGQWNRVPQERRSGLDDEGSAKRDVLVMTELFGYAPPKAATKAKKKAAPKAKAKAAAEDEDEETDSDEEEADEIGLEAQVAALVLEVVGEAEDGVPRSKLTNVVKGVDKADRAKALKMVTNKGWLEDQGLRVRGTKVTME